MYMLCSVPWYIRKADAAGPESDKPFKTDIVSLAKKSQFDAF